MKKHKFRFIRIDTKSDADEPLPTERSKTLELCDNTRKGFARGENTTVIYIEGEVGITRALEAELEKRRDKNGREDRRERGTLRGTT